jgi:hypothetical protein
MLLQTHHDNHYIAYLACRVRANERTLLGFVLELEQRTGQYRRVSPNELEEYKVDSYLTYRVTLQNVYVAAPRPDFALSLRPVRYQIANSSSTPSSPKFFLCLTDDAVRKAGFTQLDYSQLEVDWGQPRSNPDVRASPGLQLWHHNKESSVMYRNKETVGITTLSDTSLVEQVGTNCTRHPICEGACMLLMVTSDSLNLGGGKAVLIYMSPE